MRIPGLLAVLAALLLAAACTVTRTGGAAPADDPLPATSPADTSAADTSSAAPSSSSSSSSAPPTYEDEPADCADAACSITIPGRVDIPLDAEFGFTDFVVVFVPPDSMLFEGADPVNGDLHGNLGGTGNMTLNGISITVDGYGPEGARLTFTPPR